MNDIVIEMLRHGKNKLASGVTIDSIVAHLTSKKFDPTKSQETADRFFNEYFEAGTTTATASLFFLKPNGYFDLLQIDSILQSRRQATLATILAIVAILLSFIIPRWLTPNDFNLQQNKQLDSVLLYQKTNEQILNRIEMSNEITKRIDTLISQQKEVDRQLKCITKNVASIKEYLKPRDRHSLQRRK